MVESEHCGGSFTPGDVSRTTIGAPPRHDNAGRSALQPTWPREDGRQCAHWASCTRARPREGRSLRHEALGGMLRSISSPTEASVKPAVSDWRQRRPGIPPLPFAPFWLHREGPDHTSVHPCDDSSNFHIFPHPWIMVRPPTLVYPWCWDRGQPSAATA
jgi:hypothetical protein